jgi:hypothetical protein
MGYPFRSLCSALHHVPGITPGVGLLWRLLTSAPSPWQVALQGAMRKRCLRAIDGSLTSGDSIRMCLDLGFPVVLSGIFAERISSHVGQISPDKDVNCRYTTAAFTLSPESGASSCCADLPGDWALYAVSVRRLIALPEASSRRSLTVPPLPSASIWANDLNTLTGFTHRGLTPHKFTPVPGVHKKDGHRNTMARGFLY